MGLVVGFDGGGAKTAAVLCDTDGRLLARTRGPGSAIVGLPSEDFFGTVQPLVQSLLDEAGVTNERLDRMVMGLSGVDFADESRDQHRIISARLGLGDRLVLVNDGLVALWGLSADDRSVLVQHGSGVTTAYRPSIGEEAIFDSLDVADVYDVRRAAVSATARMIDGRAVRTPLMDSVLAHCGASVATFSEWCMRSPDFVSRRSALAKVVFAAWRAGDPAAGEMVTRAAQDYALTAAAMSRRVGEEPFLASFSGGVIRQGGLAFQALLEGLLREICPQANRIDPVLAPEFGAVVLGAWGLGRDARGLFARLAQQDEARSVPA